MTFWQRKHDSATPSPQTAMSLPKIDELFAGISTETATFALGWFWGPDAQFGSLPGVVRTRVGYTGGKQADPTYRRMGDHTETLEIDFDPSKISYSDLLDIFWTSHRPTRQTWSRQYMSAIFTHSPEQMVLAQASKEAQVAKHGQIHTEISPATKFYLAEDYHQKYMLRQSSGLMRVYAGIFPNPQDFLNSTAVARANGYINGYAKTATIQATLPQLGLSPADQQKLLGLAKRYH